MLIFRCSCIQSWVNCSRTNVRVAIDFTINYSQAVLLCTTCATTSTALSPLALTVANFIKKYCKKWKSLFGIGIKEELSDMSIIWVLNCRRSGFMRRIHKGDSYAIAAATTIEDQWCLGGHYAMVTPWQLFFIGSVYLSPIIEVHVSHWTVEARIRKRDGIILTSGKATSGEK